MPELVTSAEAVERIRITADTQTGTVLIAIDGCGGAGKSTLARRIAAELRDVTLVRLDDFARPTMSGWDRQRFVQQVLQPLLEGRNGRYQRWDWASDAPAEWHDVPAGGVVVVEGASSTRRELGDPWHVTIWVDAPPDVRLRRGVQRDGEAMRSTWTNRWMPEEDRYVNDQRPVERVDLVVDGGS